MMPRMRVLLVDDDPLILDSIAEVLTFDGHDVAVASNGRAALDCFAAALLATNGPAARYSPSAAMRPTNSPKSLASRKLR